MYSLCKIHIEFLSQNFSFEMPSDSISEYLFSGGAPVEIITVGHRTFEEHM